MLSNTPTSNISPAPGTQAASVSLWKLAGYTQRCWYRMTFRGRDPLLSLCISSRHNKATANRLGGGQLESRGAHTTLVLSPWGAHAALSAAAAPWADPPRALGCRD